MQEQIHDETVLAVSIRRTKRGGYVCTIKGSDGSPDDIACSQAMETMKFINDVFHEKFGEHCYVPQVVYMQPQQVQPQQHTARPPDIPSVEPVDSFPNILNRPEDPSLEARIRNRTNGRVNGVVALATAVCISASMLGARLVGA